MKKLGKKFNFKRESIEAYSCSSCDGYCPQCGNDVSLGAEIVLSRHFANVSWGN